MNPKDLEIPIKFHNYKLLKDTEFELKGSTIYFVKGPNKTGKTTFLNALKSIQLAKDETPEKITRGEQEGYYEFLIPGADNRKYLIRHEFDKETSRFIAIDDKGIKIKNVTDIRKIFNYTHFTAREFFEMSNTTEGRRKQRKIILELLSEEERNKYVDLDTLEGETYDKRRELHRNLESMEKTIQNLENQKLSELKESPDEIYAKYDKNLKGIREYDDTVREIDHLSGVIANEEQNVLDLETKLREAKDRLIARTNERQTIIKSLISKDLYEKIKAETSKLKEDYEIALLVKGVTDSIKTNKVLLEDYTKEYNELDNKIQEIRKTKKSIITESDLPFNDLTFDSDKLVINGFEFREDQVCESDAILLVAELMSKINPGPIQIIGDASLLDKDSLKKLSDIAEREGKIMFIDEVSRDASNLYIVGYEENGLHNTDDYIPTNDQMEADSGVNEDIQAEQEIEEESRAQEEDTII